MPCLSSRIPADISRRHDISARISSLFGVGPSRRTARPRQAGRTKITDVSSAGCSGSPEKRRASGGMLPADFPDWKNTCYRRYLPAMERATRTSGPKYSILEAGLKKNRLARPGEAMADERTDQLLYRGPSPERPGPGAATKPLPAQKGAQQQAAPGGGLPRNAGKAGGDRRHCG